MPGLWLIKPRPKPTKRPLGEKNTPAAEDLDCSRSGFSTTLHVVVDALGNCLNLMLMLGEEADSPQLPILLAALPVQPGAVVTDKAYDTKQGTAHLSPAPSASCHPPKANRRDQRGYDENLYVDRNKAERFLGHLKKARGFATR